VQHKALIQKHYNNRKNQKKDLNKFKNPFKALFSVVQRLLIQKLLLIKHSDFKNHGMAQIFCDEFLYVTFTFIACGAPKILKAN